MCSKFTKQFIATVWFLVVIMGVLHTPLAVWAADIDGTDKWAWSSHAGWNNFKPTHGGVSVYADHLEGYAWAENIGWIRLGAYTGGGDHTYTNTGNADYGVNRNPATGRLSGFGWATNAGWINFSPTDGGVFIDPSTGDFSGCAWAENIGWIKLKGTAADAATYKVGLSESTLTVTNGTGSGSYLPGTVVNIAANVPAAGQVFDKWTGDTANIANINLSDTTLVMPFADTTVVATYKAQGSDSTRYTLTVINGTGSGSYLPGTVVTISANAPEADYVFDKWTGATANIANINLPDTTLVMPFADTTVVATYKARDSDSTRYTLTVINGTGSGSYLPGTVVTISANAPEADYAFDKWVGQTETVKDINSATTTVNMPFHEVTVKAEYIYQYKPVPPGVGDLQMTINPFPMGWTLARWRLDGGNWFSQGTFSVSLTPGVHTVAFESVPGWITPQPLNVDITEGQTTPVTAVYLPEPSAPEPITPVWLNANPDVDLSSKIRQGQILVPTLPLLDLGSGPILSVRNLIEELLGVGGDQAAGASQPMFTLDTDAQTGLITVQGKAMAPYVIYAQLSALQSTALEDQIVFNADGNLLLVRRNLAMLLVWAGGDCEGLLRSLAGYQLFAFMETHSGLIAVTTGGGLEHYLLRFGYALSQGATAQPTLVYDETDNALYLANPNGRQRLTPFAHHIDDLRTWLAQLGWSVSIDPISGHFLVAGSDGILLWQGILDLLVSVDQTAVDFSVESAGDVNGDGLGDVRLRGAGYAQVIFSQPLD